MQRVFPKEEQTYKRTIAKIRHPQCHAGLYKAWYIQSKSTHEAMQADRKTSLNFCIHANYIIFAQEIITKTNKTT